MLALAIIAGCTKGKVHDFFPRPATTHEVREFFGCRINGLSFIPKASSESLLGNCTYKNVYGNPSGWTFQITSNRQESACRTISVSITLDSIELQEGKTYLLGTEGSKKNYAMYSIIPDCLQDKLELYTKDDKPGQITISKYDVDRGFVSGTFFYSVQDANGKVYRVSEGIFDKRLTN